MSNAKKVLAYLKTLKIAEGEEGEEETAPHDLSELLEAAHRFANGGSVDLEISFQEFLELLEEVGTVGAYLAFPDRGAEIRSDYAWDAYKEFVRSEDIDEDLLSDDDKDQLRFAIEEETKEELAFDFETTFLLRDLSAPTYEIEGGVDVEDFKADPFYAAATEAGFSEETILRFVNSAEQYGYGLMYIGILSDDAVEGYNLSTRPTGTPVLVWHDNMNGAGDYETLDGKSRTIDIENAKQFLTALDYGSYSLGDVFSTSNWTYR